MESSVGMVFQVYFWERRKLQVVAACASKLVEVRYFLLHEILLRSRFQKFVLWQIALDLSPPRLPKKTETCVCHMGKFNIPGTSWPLAQAFGSSHFDSRRIGSRIAAIAGNSVLLDVGVSSQLNLADLIGHELL